MKSKTRMLRLALSLGLTSFVVACEGDDTFSVTNCVDQDILQVQGDELRFGMPGTDRCAARPTELQDFPYRRVGGR